MDDAATRAFRLALVDGLMLADGALTNSEFVADQVREFMRQRTTFELPVMAVPLATELRPISGDKKSLGAKVREIVSEDFVLAVSTIENRKNYVYLVRIWETLLRNHVPNVPHLVFVGKLGWDIRPFIDRLNATDYLGGRLHLLHDVSDYELSELYKHAMFTMYPSFAEGFGLPVGESLGYGKPCLSSNRASMPEVGGKFARYFDPDDVNEGYAEVLRLLQIRRSSSGGRTRSSPNTSLGFGRILYRTSSTRSPRSTRMLTAPPTALSSPATSLAWVATKSRGATVSESV